MRNYERMLRTGRGLRKAYVLFNPVRMEVENETMASGRCVIGSVTIGDEVPFRCLPCLPSTGFAWLLDARGWTARLINYWEASLTRHRSFIYPASRCLQRLGVVNPPTIPSEIIMHQSVTNYTRPLGSRQPRFSWYQSALAVWEHKW